jgi:iron complex transport system ATP-binding protein
MKTTGETIELRNLSIGYQTKHGIKTVATGIDGTIKSGELTCLLGANGVGKSTLLKTLSSFQPRTGGEILLEGRELSEYSDKQLSRLIGVVLTEKPDVRNMTVRELVSLGRSPYTGFWGTYSKDDLQVVDEAIAMVGIEPLKKRMVHTLSDGERQKVMIAKALAQQTPVIYLDEPTAFLDYPSKVEVLQLLCRISREADKVIFLSTHDVELALQMADTIWLMTQGEAVAIGSPKALAEQGALGRFIEREGIAFDPMTMTIKVTKQV